MAKKNKIHCIRTYFNDEEYALLIKHEMVLGITKQQLVRKVLIENAKPNIINARELLRIFDSVGVNIAACNAMLYEHLANKTLNTAETHSEESFSVLIQDYLGELRNLERAIRLLLFKMKT